MRVPLFRIWYSSTYTGLFILVLVLIAVTPGDTIYQSYRNSNIENIFVIAGAHLITALLVIFVYASRLYTNRAALAAIPKAYIPVEPGEVGTNVRRLIAKQLERSALIAWDSRPRDISNAIEVVSPASASRTTSHHLNLQRPATADRAPHALTHAQGFKRRLTGKRGGWSAVAIPIASAERPPWGAIEHPGWSCPASPDLPNVQFLSVIRELPNLIEARAVSMAPVDPAFAPQPPGNHAQDQGDEGAEGQMPGAFDALPDARVVAALRRPAAMTLREYIGRLTSFGLIKLPTLGARFVAQYERARFGPTPATEEQFRVLMDAFAELLGGMNGLEEDVVAELRASVKDEDEHGDSDEDADSDHQSFANGSGYYSEGHLERRESGSDASTQSGSRMPFYTPRPPHAGSEPSSSESLSSSNSVTGTIRTAPSRAAKVSSGTRAAPRTPSGVSMGSRQQQQRPTFQTETELSSSAASSLRSARSVIRLTPSPGQNELPYQFEFERG